MHIFILEFNIDNTPLLLYNKIIIGQDIPSSKLLENEEYVGIRGGNEIVVLMRFENTNAKNTAASMDLVVDDF